MVPVLRIVFLAFTIVSCDAILYERFSDLPKTEYDFVVIGGGAAGNVIANRLTEDPNVSVLVLEAGPSNQGVIESMVPFFWPSLSSENPWNWNFTTVPQPGLGGRSFLYNRGHILGGSTSINGMFYTRGSKEDYDRYAKLTGDQGWSWDSLQPYIRKNEKWSSPTDNHDTRGQFNPAIHSFNGINSVSLSGFPSPTDHRVIETTQQLADNFPFNLDMNSGKPIGLSWLQTTIKKGQRSSSATSYLAPQFLLRTNLHVLLHSQVSRLLKTSSEHEQLEMKTVELSQVPGPNAPRHQVHAAKEVILSAGVVGTPWILMNSGIGDKGELEALGIPSLHHLPSVGKNASDHPVYLLTWLVNSTDTTDKFTQNTTLFNEAFSLWNKTHEGPFGNPTASHVAWLRLPQNASIFDTFPDPAAGPNTPHYELIISNGHRATAGNVLAISVAVVTTPGRGSIKLSSNDPFAPPLVDPAMLSTDFDIFTARKGLRSAELFVTAPTWKDYVLAPTGGLENVHTDEEADAYIRSTTSSIWHLVGSAAMSPKDAKYGVVDPDLRVKGISGLRIVDSSVIPIVPAAHTQVPTYIFAERGADLIKSLWKLR